MKNVVIALFMLLLIVSLTAGTQLVDFNNPTDLDNYFDIAGASDVSNLSNSGLENTGSVYIPALNWTQARICTYQTGFEVVLDEPISVSAYFNNTYDSGYGTIGFSTASSNTAEPECQIIDNPAYGMCYHGSGDSFINDDYWFATKSYVDEFDDPLDLNIQWLKIILTITPLSGNRINGEYAIYYSDANGVISEPAVRTNSTVIVNNAFTEGTTIYPYFGESWARIQNFDNFSVTGTDATLPVTLSSFSAITTSNNFANIQWTTASESNLIGYNIYRNELENMNTAIRINPTYIQATNSATGSQYSYTDEEVEMNTNYYYWLQSTEIDGFVEIYGPVSVKISGQSEDIEPVIPTSELKENYPNPFNPETTFEFFVKEGERGEFSIFNLKGQVIITKFFETGQHQYVWNGRDNLGKKVASGSYFYKLKTDSYQAVKKMILQK